MTRLHRQRISWIALAAALLALGMVAGVWVRSLERNADGPVADSVQASKPALWWQWLEEPLSGNTSLERLRSDWLVLNFWASWCEPCRDEMPLLMSAFESEGLPLLGINMDDRAEAAYRVLDELGITYPTWRMAPTSALALIEAYGGSGALPFTVLLDAKQTPVATHTGLVNQDLLRRWHHAVTQGAP